MPFSPDDVEQIEKAVGRAVAESKGKNPYHVPIQFLVGAIAFTLALTIAIVSALVGRDPAKVQPAIDAMLGGILGWLALALCFQIVIATLFQIGRFVAWPTTVWVGSLMFLAGISGVPVLLLAIRGAAAVKTGILPLPPIGEAVKSLVQFW